LLLSLSVSVSYALLPPLILSTSFYLFFFFNATPTTNIYTLSLHDALPIYLRTELSTGVDSSGASTDPDICAEARAHRDKHLTRRDRKSTRLNSSHQIISYAVFCLKKKKKKKQEAKHNTMTTTREKL